MKIHTLVYLAAAATPSFACVHSVGSVVFRPSGPVLEAAYIVDNGDRVCDSSRGHWVEGLKWRIGCKDGYGMKLADNGVHVWYDTPHGSYHWQHTGRSSNRAFAWKNWRFC